MGGGRHIAIVAFVVVNHIFVGYLRYGMPQKKAAARPHFLLAGSRLSARPV